VDLEYLERDYDMDNGGERRLFQGFRCRMCGAMEEL
jgi:hypothetical protein